MRVTNADKRRRVAEALKLDDVRGWSNRRVAEWCGVGHPFVASLRPELESDSSSDPPKTIGRDGKARKPPVKREPKATPTFVTRLRPDVSSDDTPKATNADKRRRVAEALKLDDVRGWSNRRVAEWCGVDHKTVAAARPEPTGEVPQLPTVGRDGKARKPPVKREQPPNPRIPEPEETPESKEEWRKIAEGFLRLSRSTKVL